jgi:2'-5' RNA ligase
VPETAIAVLFPELEPIVGESRLRYTRDGARDMPPHVTLIYPFADSSAAEDMRATVADELGRFRPFEVAFRSTSRFPGTLILPPEPAEPFVAMTETLLGAFRDYTPYGGAFEEVVPHLTVAHGDLALLDALEAELGDVEVSARVELVWLVENRPEGWRRHTPFPLNRSERV